MLVAFSMLKIYILRYLLPPSCSHIIMRFIVNTNNIKNKSSMSTVQHFGYKKTITLQNRRRQACKIYLCRFYTTMTESL